MTLKQVIHALGYVHIFVAGAATVAAVVAIMAGATTLGLLNATMALGNLCMAPAALGRGNA